MSFSVVCDNNSIPVEIQIVNLLLSVPLILCKRYRYIPMGPVVDGRLSGHGWRQGVLCQQLSRIDYL